MNIPSCGTTSASYLGHKLMDLKVRGCSALRGNISPHQVHLHALYRLAFLDILDVNLLGVRKHILLLSEIFISISTNATESPHMFIGHECFFFDVSSCLLPTVTLDCLHYSQLVHIFLTQLFTIQCLPPFVTSHFLI